MEEENIKINTGFDRGVDYEIIKEKLINKIQYEWDKYQLNNKKVTLSRLIYILIASIQLRNGSRISEAVKAFIIFVNKGINSRVVVKISKSDGHYKNKNGDVKQKKIRYREMMFPSDWFDNLDFWDEIKNSKITKKLIESGRLRKRVLDFMLINFNCNTHSLRYAFINHMLYVIKRPPEDIAKFVGHIDTKMLSRYVQLKNCNQIFDLDI